MFGSEQIEAIVATYDLSPAFSKRISRIAAIRINERGISSFNEAYTLISNLIEKWQSIHSETYNSFSLDSKQASGDFLHDRIGREDEYMKRLFEDNENICSKEHHFKEIMSTLEKILEGKYLTFLNQLFSSLKNQEEKTFGVELEELRNDSTGVRERLDEIARRFKVDGRLAIPPVPIVEIKFNPLFIRFQQRDFDGNPLAYFLSHNDVYKDVSRSQLKRIDPYLYVALLRANQLDIAIPQKKGVTYRGFESPLTYYIAHHEKYKGLNPRKLQKLDPGLYDALRRKNQLYQAINFPSPHSL